MARANGNASTIDVVDLYRHEELNPFDNYIPPALREELRSLIEATAADVRQAATLMEESRGKEMQALIEAGGTERVAIQPHGFVIPSALLSGGTLMMRGGEKEAHWAPKDKLPKTGVIQDYVTHQGASIGSAIIAWFEKRGICPSRQATTLSSGLAR